MADTFSSGRKLYELTLRIVRITDFGVTLEDLLEGKALPAEGVRLDVELTGTSAGELEGTVEAVDYLYVRPDGRFDLDVRAVLTTPEESRVAVKAGGVGEPRDDGTVRLTEYVRLHTSDERYSWVNRAPAVGAGWVNPSTGEASIEAYVP